MTARTPLLLISDHPAVVDLVGETARSANCDLSLLSPETDLDRVAVVRARLVVLGPDAVPAWTAATTGGLATAAEVVLVGVDDEAVLRRAAAGCGAHRVLILPAGRGWLAGRCHDVAARPPANAPVTGVAGVVGGAGASTLAVMLAERLSVGRHAAWLFDLDPSGGGLAGVVGDDAVVSWEAATRGGPQPRPGRPVILSGGLNTARPELVSATAARLGTAPAVLDLPRPDAALHPAWGLVDRAVLVMPNRARAVEACRQAIALLEPVAPLDVVVRAQRGGVWLGDLQSALRRPVIRWPDDRRIDAASEDAALLGLARTCLGREMGTMLHLWGAAA